MHRYIEELKLDFKVAHDLRALQSNGFEFKEMAIDEVTMQISFKEPFLAKGFLERKNIINNPKVQIENYQLTFENDVEMCDAPKRKQDSLQLEIKIMFKALLESLKEDVNAFVSKCS